jgi:peroxiredoxin
MLRLFSMFVAALLSLLVVAASAQGQGTGTARIYLVNDWDYAATYYVNEHPYVVRPGERLPLDVAAGTVFVEIRGDQVGLVQPNKAMTLDPGQEITVRVHRKDVPDSTSLKPGAKRLADLVPEEFTRTQDHVLLGKRAPAFELSDQNDRRWRLEDQLARGPVVLVFYEGSGCPKCQQHLRDLQAEIASFRGLGAEVVGISKDSSQVTRDTLLKDRVLSYPLLSDPESTIAQRFGVEEHGVFIIGRDGTVVWAYRGNAPFTSRRTLLYEVAVAQGLLPAKRE